MSKLGKSYELQEFSDFQLPVKFHTDRIYSGENAAHSLKNIKNNILDHNILHWHEGLEILRFTEGQASILLDTVTITAKRGDIVIINTSELHLISVDGDECVYDVLGIDHRFCLDWGYKLGELFYKSIARDAELDAIFDKIAVEYRSKEPFYKTVVSASCLELVALITRKYLTERPSGDPSLYERLELVRRIIQHISKNYASQQILESLCEQLNYSQFYLSHIFKEMMNITIKEYQMQTRFTVAEKHLRASDTPVSDIARMCGYNNPASFTAEFKKRHGITPAEYRRLSLLNK